MSECAVYPVGATSVIPAASAAAWYAVYTRSNFESRVAADLAAKGIQHLLPAVDEIHRWKDRKKRVSVPLFPGYLFVRMIDDPESRLAVLKTSGTVRILGYGGEITPVPENQIDAVRSLVTSQSMVTAVPYLREGTAVRVKYGPLRGLEGYLVRIKSACRIVVSVHLLAQSVSAEVDCDDVESIM